VSDVSAYSPYNGCFLYYHTSWELGDATDRGRRYGTNKTSNSTVRNNVLSGAFAFGLVSGSGVWHHLADPAKDL
jgi:hypothetical protein